MNMSSIKLPKWTAVFALALASVLFVNWAVAQKSTGRGRGDPLAYFKKHDANGAGRLTGDEIPARMRNRLKGIDTDADGVVTLQEFREMLGRKMSGKARGPGKHKIGKGRIMAEIMKRLELTEEQKAVMWGPYSGHGGKVPSLVVNASGAGGLEGGTDIDP